MKDETNETQAGGEKHLPLDPESSQEAESTNLPPLSSIGPEATEVGEALVDEYSHRVVEKIGSYKIIREIGEGGMGSVFEAEQLEPVKRTVALKVIKAGRDTKSVIARFEAERQALAMMDHPSIARILDAGETDFGQPFFAMELVNGVPLTKYCDQHSLSISERLTLFCKICDGVQHAHQKGIIHRDLKPGNILVTEYDGKPVPKIIDFGLAKALETTDQLTDKSLATEFGQVLGTIKYMSPEQAGLNALDIDTRSDIYSLGIILYELLTGSTPLDDSSIQENALFKVLELVREKEAPRPSSRISTSSNQLSTISSRRQIEPRRLNSILAGELDWVVMKSLEKDRDRRYSSANEFSDDIDRYLNNDPILARPPSRSYQLRKFVRKNRGFVGSAATIAVLLIVGISGTTWFALGEKAARELAQQNEKLANDNALQSAKDKNKAEKSAKRAKDSLKIFTDSFRSVDPSAGANAKMSAKDVLFNAFEKLKKSELDDVGKAELFLSLTTSFIGVGAYDSAVATAESELDLRREFQGTDHPDTLNAMGNLAYGYRLSGQIKKSLTLDQQVVALMTDTFGADHPNTMDSINNLAGSYGRNGQTAKAREQFKKLLVLQRNKLGLQNDATLTTMNNLAVSYFKSGQVEDAQRLFQKVFELRKERLGSDHPSTLISMHSLASMYRESGQAEKAIPLELKVLELRQSKLGPVHPETLFTMQNLASSYLSVGLLKKSLDLNRKTFNLVREKLGNDHPETLTVMHNLAVNCLQQGQFKESLELSQKVYDMRSDKLGPDHEETLDSMGILANCLSLTGKIKEAFRLNEELFEKRRKLLGPDHPSTLYSMHHLAGSYSQVGQVDKSQELLQQLLELMSKKIGPDHPNTLSLMNDLAVSYHQTGRRDKARKLFEQMYKSRREKLGPDHPETLDSMNNLAVSYRHSGQIDESLELSKQVLDLRRKKLGEDHPETLRSISSLASGYAGAGRLDEATDLNKTVLEMRRKKLGADHQDTLFSMNNLAENYFNAGKFDESLKLFEEVVEKATQKLGRNHQTTQLSIANLGANYKVVGRFEEAIPLLEEAYQSSKKLAGLRKYVDDLRDVYIAANKSSKLGKLIEELIAQANQTDDPTVLDTELIRGGKELLQVRDYVGAEKLLIDYVRRQENKKAESWVFHEGQSLLGSAILKQAKRKEAEPWLRKGYFGLKDQAENIPDNVRLEKLLKAVEGLMNLAAQAEEDSDAARWRSERDWIKSNFDVQSEETPKK